ncbi:MAG: PilT/PilU family type 4a pilus ATPase [Candidatus Gastranaerophilales bacterium]|nr:PilT/PilU family type 4a pilus ATPase [Candidatus Gastranaerophilales bacterium]
MINHDINNLLQNAIEIGASDLHFIVNEVPAFRVDGKIIKTNLPIVTEEDMAKAIEVMAPVSMRERALNSFDSDFPYEIEGVCRFRVNVAMSFGYHSMTVRLVSYKIPSFKELNLPACVEKFSHFENGIVLVTGVAGSGKSTTIASILDYINNTRNKHIVTIEDPIEYIYKSNKSIFTQRQIGIDTGSYIDGLKYALRQDPDVILIGEIRDMDTVQSALHAAETGHLVFATLHTYNAVQTINRILSFFPPAEREVVRLQFAELFRGSISQRLLLNASGKGRIPALEVLFTTPTIKDFILKDELDEIHKMVQKGAHDDMFTFNMCLFNLLKRGLITKETALEHTDNKNELMHYIRGAFTGTSQ